MPTSSVVLLVPVCFPCTINSKSYCSARSTVVVGFFFFGTWLRPDSCRFQALAKERSRGCGDGTLVPCQHSRSNRGKSVFDAMDSVHHLFCDERFLHYAQKASFIGLFFLPRRRLSFNIIPFSSPIWWLSHTIDRWHSSPISVPICPANRTGLPCLSTSRQITCPITLLSTTCPGPLLTDVDG